MELTKIEDTDREDDFVNKLEAMPKPVFVQKSNIKIKTNKYSKNLRIWMDTLKIPYYSSGNVRISNHPLEKIPEEETLLNDHHKSADITVNKNESSILSNSHAFSEKNDSDIDNNRTDSCSQMNGCLKFDNADSVEHPLLEKVEPPEVNMSEVGGDNLSNHLLSNTCKYVNNLTTSPTTNLISTNSTIEALPNELPNVVTGPIYKKKHLKRAFDKPGEDKVILSLGEDFYFATSILRVLHLNATLLYYYLLFFSFRIKNVIKIFAHKLKINLEQCREILY